MKYFTVVVPQESGQLPVSRLGDAMRSAGMNPNEVGLTLERFHQFMQVRIEGFKMLGMVGFTASDPPWHSFVFAVRGQTKLWLVLLFPVAKIGVVLVRFVTLLGLCAEETMRWIMLQVQISGM